MKKYYITVLSLTLFGCASQAPITEWFPHSSAAKLPFVRHENYAFGYHEESEQAAWVFYELLASELQGERQQRSDNFREDPLVPTGSASLADYRKSGYDRGHLAPAADMAFSREAMEESFYLSNMSPQQPGFNRGIWRELESLVREWAEQYQRLFVVTAGIVLTEETLPTIGANKVRVPRHYYKIIYDPQRQSMIAFLLENRKHGKGEDLSRFALSVDRIEELSLLDFFPQLPDSIETRIEAISDLNHWDFGQ
ncbi:MAG: DNA/RNA non-specific endonuclease [Spirochaetota bacterium]